MPRQDSLTCKHPHDDEDDDDDDDDNALDDDDVDHDHDQSIHHDHHRHLETIEDNNSKLEDILDSINLDFRWLDSKT